MKIKWQGFLHKNHSWSLVAQNISRVLISRGHDVDLFPTDRDDKNTFPSDLESNVQSTFVEKYDMQLSYTAFKNFNKYFVHGDRNRFGIWNYETTVLPAGFAKGYKDVDMVLPSSNFSKQIFLDAGIPNANMTVVPHGISLSESSAAIPLQLKTKKKIKFCANIAQPHIRKNIDGLLKAWGRAFNKKDDVCLVLKIVDKKPEQSFDLSFQKLYQQFKLKFPNSAEIEIIQKFIPNIYSLYKACDVTMTLSRAECWYLPAIEAMTCGNIIIAPRYGGQLDYLDDTNSLLIGGNVVPASPEMQYWTQSPFARVFEPSIDDAVAKLRYCRDHFEQLKSQAEITGPAVAKRYTWDLVVDKIMDLVV